MTTPVNILLVEDEPQIRRFVRAALAGEGFHVFEAENAKQGLSEAATRQPDLVILDLGLPDSDGMDLLRDLRNWSKVPVVILSARTEERDKIAALDLGADDYLVKPFGVGELLARVRAALRRSTAFTPEENSQVVFGDVRLDLAVRRVSKGQESVHLTAIEYRLLAFLAAHPGKVLTHRQILREVWGPSHSDASHYLRIYMSHLRQKLEVDPTQPKYFLTETGVGYRFAID
jgi:two-component system KDP operon response regulator KdpE